MSCPVCESYNVIEFLERNNVSIHQNLLVADHEQARDINSGTLCMYYCKNCSFIFNHCFDPDKLSYGEHYDNSQTYSAYFNNYLNELANYLLHKRGIADSKIVEIGCGKGDFLRLLVADNKNNNIGYGFDPSYVGPVSDLNNKLTFEKRFYGRNCTDIKADVVICRHVIEHVPDPIKLLFSIRSALGDNAKIFFETPCVEWILENESFWDFFYEHCSLFSTSSLTTAFQRTGFKVDGVTKNFGGQYLWLEASTVKEDIQKKNPLNGNTLERLVVQFAEKESRFREKWDIRTKKIAEQGKLALWGAGAKGVTFAQLIDPECRYIECIIDLNPNKQGKFLPGSGHPIVDLQEAGRRKIKHAILMNPNYFEENLQLVQQENLDLTLIHVT